MLQESLGNYVAIKWERCTNRSSYTQLQQHLKQPQASNNMTYHHQTASTQVQVASASGNCLPQAWHDWRCDCTT
jgi:hypothetical protein